MTLPLIVVEGTTEVEASVVVADARAELASLAWDVVDTREMAESAGGRVWSLVVADDAQAALAVLAAVEGIGLLVEARAERVVIDRLCDDLRRLGHLEHRIGAGGPLLSVEERTLLDLLSDGVSLGQAARQLHLSRRTADRRLSSARAAFGVETTAQTIAAHRRRLDRLPRPN